MCLQAVLLTVSACGQVLALLLPSAAATERQGPNVDLIREREDSADKRAWTVTWLVHGLCLAQRTSSRARLS